MKLITKVLRESLSREGIRGVKCIYGEGSGDWMAVGQFKGQEVTAIGRSAHNAMFRLLERAKKGTWT